MLDLPSKIFPASNKFKARLLLLGPSILIEYACSKKLDLRRWIRWGWSIFYWSTYSDSHLSACGADRSWRHKHEHQQPGYTARVGLSQQAVLEEHAGWPGWESGSTHTPPVAVPGLGVLVKLNVLASGAFGHEVSTSLTSFMVFLCCLQKFPPPWSGGAIWVLKLAQQIPTPGTYRRWAAS